jgi:hypothetical protein
MNATMKKDYERSSCSHCHNKGHDEDHCWKLHPDLKRKWAWHHKSKKKTTTMVQDLGSYSDNETKVKTMRIKGILYVARSVSCASSSKTNVILDERKRNELFHIRVISKHTKIDTLVDNGSQVNLFSKKVVNDLGLETKPHPRSYPLGWVYDNAKLHVTKQCKIRFAITSNFIDGVDLDVVPLDICGIVLGSPYLYDRKAIFYMEHNMYHIFKDGTEFVVRAHRINTKE